MTSPLIERLHTELAYPRANEDTIEQLLTHNEYLVLFFTGAVARYPESNDVAVVLPELLAHYADKLCAAVVHPEDEATLKERFPFGVWPALVFLHRGVQVETITRIKDWADYIEKIDAVLQPQPADGSLIGNVNI